MPRWEWSESRNILEVKITKKHKDFQGDGYVQIFIVGMVSQTYIYAKFIKSYTKYVQFIVYQLYIIQLVKEHLHLKLSYR